MKEIILKQLEGRLKHLNREYRRNETRMRVATINDLDLHTEEMAIALRNMNEYLGRINEVEKVIRLVEELRFDEELI